MPRAKEALDQWLEGLKTQGKLSDEKLEAIRSAFETPEAVEYAGGSFLRQEDYSRQLNEIKTKEQEVTNFQAALSEWKGQAESEYFEMQKAKAKAETEVAKLKELARNYVPESELGKVDEVVTPKVEAQPQIDTSEFIKAKDAQEVMLNTLKVQNQMMAIAAQHQKLFGEPLDDAELIERAIANKRDISLEWQEHYKVADKRAELATQVQEARDQRIREEERAKVLSELKLPETRPGVPRSPVMTMSEKPAEGAAEQRTGIQAALEAYGAGKYRASS